MPSRSGMIVASLWIGMFTGGVSAQPLEWCHAGLPAGPVVLREDGQGNLYIAVCQVEGQLLVRPPESGDFRELYHGEVSGMAAAFDGTIWYVSGKQVFRRGPGAAAVVDRTAAFGQMLSPPRGVFAARGGEIYVSGATRYRAPDARFPPRVTTTVSRAVVDVMADDPFGNEWGLARGAGASVEVVTRNTVHSTEWTVVPVDQIGEWQSLLVDDVGYVWLLGRRELLRLDPRHPDSGWKHFPTEQLPATVSCVARNPNRQVLAGLADGTIWELAWGPKGAIVTRALDGVARTGEAIRAMHVDGRGDLWAVAGGRVGRRPAPANAWQQSWQEVSRLPAGNHDIIFAQEDQHLYTAGGKTYFGFPAAEWVNLDEIWQYHIDHEVWRVDAPMLQPGKAYSGIATLAGEIWLIGGLLRAGQGTRAVADVEIYNPRTRRVRPGPPLDVARGQVVALTLGDRLYAVGGATDQSPLAVMVSIGDGENKWRDEPSPPGSIEQASGCVLDGKLYVAAGQRSGCPGLFVYDPRERKWSSLAHPTGMPPHAPLCAAHGGRVWVLGGWGGSDGRAAFHYDPRSQAWARGPDIPLPLSWGAAIEVGERLMIAGGAYRDDDVGDYFNSDRVFLLRSNPATNDAR